MFVSEVGNPCPTLGQLLASRILYALLVGEKQHEIARARFRTQSCSNVGQFSGMGDSQRDSHESIRANHSQLKPHICFCTSGRFARITALSWPTLDQLLANSPPHEKLQGSSLRHCRSPLATPKRHHTLMPVATQLSSPLFPYPLFKPARSKLLCLAEGMQPPAGSWGRCQGKPDKGIKVDTFISATDLHPS